MTYIANSLEGSENGLDDPLFNEAADLCREIGRVSISSLQRRFKISFYRSCSIVKALYDQGFEVSQMVRETANQEVSLCRKSTTP